MPTRSVVGDVATQTNTQEGFATHTILFYGDDCPEAKKQRK